jgi:NADPH:quinone reductase-like Zn-dependent oxidoreductase
LKAIRIHQHGGVELLRYEDTADPVLQSPEHVVVRLKAAALNLSDVRFRQGIAGKRSCLPRILGCDGAGVIAAVGSAVEELKIGDRVCLYPQSGCTTCWACRSDRPWLCEHPQRLGEQVDGTYAEYVSLHRQNCFLLPAELAFEQAAAIPVAYLSAWRMLLTDAELKPGESVLIRGIGNSAATAALQLALSLGAHTIVTADSREKLSQALELGARSAIDEVNQDFPTEVRRLTGKRGVDVVVDCVGGDSWAKSFAALNRGGRLVTSGASAGSQPATDLRRIFWHHLRVFGSTLGSRDELRRVLAYLTTSGTKPAIDAVYPLAHAAQAQQRLAQGDCFGKIVLRVDT